MAFGAPVMIILYLAYLGIAAIIPFIFGLFNFSKRTLYWYAAVLTLGLFCLGAIAFCERLKYQSVPSGISLSVIWIAATAGTALLWLAVFLIAYWLGSTVRSGIIWIHSQIA